MALNKYKPSKPFVPLAVNQNGRPSFTVIPQPKSVKISQRKQRRMWGK